MSTSILTREGVTQTFTSRLADYLEMTKPRIVILELIVAAIAACVAMPHGLDTTTILHALFGTALVAASASVANSWWERRSDALMPRTASRPLPTGRVSSGEAFVAFWYRASGRYGLVDCSRQLADGSLGACQLGDLCTDLYAAEEGDSSQYHCRGSFGCDSYFDGLDCNRSTPEPHSVCTGNGIIPVAIPAFHGDCMALSE